MKKILITIICFLIFTVTKAQSNTAIANTYINKAYEAIDTSIDFNAALSYFEKAMEYDNEITDRSVAALGASIYFETHHKRPTIEAQIAFLEKSISYSSKYFSLYKNKNSDEYFSSTEGLATIQRSLRKLKEEQKIIHTLKVKWKNKFDALTLQVDSIYKFNKNNLALYTKNGNFGVIDDRGKIIVEATNYKDAINSGGFILLKNRKIEPNKIYCFNTNNKNGFLLPSVSKFNPMAKSERESYIGLSILFDCLVIIE